MTDKRDLAGHRLAAILQAAAAALPDGQHELRDVDTPQEAARQARLSSKRLYNQGKLAPLGVNPATGKRLQHTGRYPTTGIYSPILPRSKHLPSATSLEGRFKTRRERAIELQERMRAFTPIYNAGWLVRDAYFGPDQHRREKVMALFAVLVQVVQQTDDYEALLFALADALYASPLGVPWEP